jgi:hypothetical protein
VLCVCSGEEFGFKTFHGEWNGSTGTGLPLLSCLVEGNVVLYLDKICSVLQKKPLHLEDLEGLGECVLCLWQTIVSVLCFAWIDALHESMG